MDLSSVLSKNPGAAYRVYDGLATVVLPGRAEVNVLNEVGSLIWHQINGERTLADILQTVLGEFDITEEQAKSDLFEFIGALHKHEMVNG